VAAPASLLKQANNPTQRPAASPPHRAPEDLQRYALHVFAPSIADAVVSVGGLIFDQAMAGWDVTVVTEANGGEGGSKGFEGVDDRPIRILGARLAGPDRLVTAPRPQMLVVATDVVVKSEPLRRLVLAARNVNAAEVLFWGRYQPPNLKCGFVPVRHQPSAAAHVFKSHALAAGGAVGGLQLADEGFYSMT
jgi:hypothetical protein